MTQPFQPAEEESESVSEIGRITRTLGTAAMQVRESLERQRYRREKAEHDERMDDSKTADTLHQDAYSSRFWQTTSNHHLASSVLDSQELGAKGHGSANSAYMAFADQIRDRYGLNIEAAQFQEGAREERMNKLLTALDDHNEAGRLREESQEQSAAAEQFREGEQARSEDYAAHRPELREAALGEAEEAGLDTDEYLDRLTDDQRESLLNDPENAEARDDRLAAVTDPPEGEETKEAAGTDADRTHEESHPQEKGHDQAATDADRDADQAELSAEAQQRQADQLPGSAHDKAMDRQMKDDPQLRGVAEQRRPAIKNDKPGEFLNNSVNAKTGARKARQGQQAPGRVHEMSR